MLTAECKKVDDFFVNLPGDSVGATPAPCSKSKLQKTVTTGQLLPCWRSYSRVDSQEAETNKKVDARRNKANVKFSKRMQHKQMLF